MANTPNFNLYKPNRADTNVEVDTTLSDNFTRIDTELKARLDEIETHKNNPWAHTSDKITHADGSVKGSLENHEERLTQTTTNINTLVLPPLDNLSTKMLDLEPKVNSLENTQSNHETRISSNELKAANHEPRLTTVEGKANNLDERVTDIEVLGIDKLAPNLEGRITTLESDIEGVVAPSTFSSLSQQNVTFNDLRMGYVNNKLDPVAAKVDTLTTQLAEKAAEITNLQTAKADKTEINTLASGKADKTYVDTLASSLATGSPKGTYATLSALQTALPTGNSNIYLVTADGKWYYWNGSAWTAGGVYQSTGIDANTVPSVLENKVINGDFTNGVNNWNVTAGTKEISTSGYNDATAMLFTATGNFAYASQQLSGLTVGDVYYLALKIKKNAATSYAIDIGGGYEAKTFINDLYHAYSKKITASASSVTLNIYPDSAAGSTSGKSVIIDKVIAINLSAFYGKGKEPTIADFETFLQNFTDSFFDGVVAHKTIQSLLIKTDKDIKADIATNKATIDTANIKITDHDNQIYSTLENKITNGDFINGVAEWTPTNGTKAVSASGYNDTTALLFSATSGYGYANRKLTGLVVGDVYFVGFKIKKDVATTYSVIFDGVYEGKTFAGSMYESYSVKRAVTASSVDLNIYPDNVAANAAGKSVIVDKVLVVNLTAFYGKGNEPTVAKFNEYLLNFKDGYFEGKVPISKIQDIKIGTNGSKFLDETTGKTYSWGLKQKDGNMIFTYEEVL